MKKINWGIIGCGDVTELKSGPAFNKVPNSSLVAVMRRDAVKAEDYAKRHGVPRWYNDASMLMNDPEVNAVYIATPPSSHEEYTIAAIRAGKPVYVEKPMALSYTAARNMTSAANSANIKLVVAHYRRQWPLFQKIKKLLTDNAIGTVLLARLQFYKTPMSHEKLLIEKNAWRVNPAISGGGLFHDLAPHQLGLMYYFFGSAVKVNGIAANQSKVTAAADMVSGNILFASNISFSGIWCFNAATDSDYCEIIGSQGKINFSFFGSNSIELLTNSGSSYFTFEPLLHVQQPMIEKTVQYFLGKADNPCTAAEGAETMRWIDAFTG
jgi:predicted dehydrogenase